MFQNLPKMKTVLAGSILGLDAPASAASACRGGYSGSNSPGTAPHHGCSHLGLETHNPAQSEGKGPALPCTAEHTAQNAGTLPSYPQPLLMLPQSPQCQTARLSGQMQCQKAANSLPSLAWHGSVQTLERQYSRSGSGKYGKEHDGKGLQCLEQPCLLYAQCSPVSLPKTAAQSHPPNYCQGCSCLAWSCATEASAAGHDSNSREALAAAQQGSCLWRMGTLQADCAGMQGDHSCVIVCQHTVIPVRPCHERPACLTASFMDVYAAKTSKHLCSTSLKLVPQVPLFTYAATVLQGMSG